MSNPSPNPWQRRVSLLLPLTVTVALLVWAWRGVSFTAVGKALVSAQLPWLVFGVLTFLPAFLFRAHRWGILLGVQRYPGSFRLRTAAVYIGFAGNCVLPANMGELIRVGILHRFAGIPFATGLGSILTARLLDAMVAFLFLLAPLIVPNPDHSINLSRLPLPLLGGILAILGGGFLLAAHYPGSLLQAVDRLARLTGWEGLRVKLVAVVKTLLEGLVVLRYPRLTLIAIVDTLCLWSLSGLTFWAVLIAFNLSTPGYPGALFIQSVQAMAAIIPSTPGHLGAFEAAVRFALEVYAIPPETIVAYTLVVRLLIYGSLTITGAICALRLGLTRADLLPR